MGASKPTVHPCTTCLAIGALIAVGLRAESRVPMCAQKLTEASNGHRTVRAGCRRNWKRAEDLSLPSPGPAHPGCFERNSMNQSLVSRRLVLGSAAAGLVG